jgi:hypothetical protein
MRDPHVESLRYRLETSVTTTYKNPPAVEVIRDEFECRLSDGVLTCRMKKHYPTVEEARRVIDGFLRSWEIKTALELGRDEMRFQFEDSHMVDRDPPPPGSSQIVRVSAASVGVSTLLGRVHVTRNKYPDAPSTFAVTPDVETLWQRYENYLDGREPLPSMAYFCLTVVENKAGSRRNAAKEYSIDKRILDKLGELTSTRGDTRTARKALKGGSTATLSGKEKNWIEGAVRALIRRTGEVASTQPVPCITMSDLPEI